MALTYLIHFVGDIHQPLHDEAKEIGGNDIPVTFDGYTDNLHSIWDTWMPEKIRAIPSSPAPTDAQLRTDASAWATALKSTSINVNTTCNYATDPLDCAMFMAQEVNAFDCSTVFKYSYTGELNGTYYKEATPVITELINRAGVRLANWINAIAVNV
jgi:hypothetical protein